jgi:hypothetical protein
VNYAIKKAYIMAFVQNQPDAAKHVQTATEGEKVSFEEAVEKVRKSMVLVWGH